MAFLLAQKVERARGIVAEAASGPGTHSERMARVFRAMLHQMADQPALCTRLMCWMATPTGEQSLIEAQGSLMAPVRALFVEGQANGEFADIDPTDATTAIMGALSMGAMRHTVNGDFDADAVGDRLIPWLLDGLRTRRNPDAGRSSNTSTPRPNVFVRRTHSRHGSAARVDGLAARSRAPRPARTRICPAPSRTLSLDQ